MSALASVFQVDHLFDFPAREVRFSAFNTHAYLSDFYLDFGVVGAIVMPFFLGCLVKWSYVASEKSNDVMVISIWICFAFGTLNLFFSNHFTGVGYPVVAVVLFSSYRWFRQLLLRVSH